MVGSRFLVRPILDFTPSSLEDQVRVDGLVDGRKGASGEPVAAAFEEGDC